MLSASGFLGGPFGLQLFLVYDDYIIAFHGSGYDPYIPNQSSVFTAEAHALYIAFECIENSDQTNCVVFSNSFSCLLVVKNLKVNQPTSHEKCYLNIHSFVTALMMGVWYPGK